MMTVAGIFTLGHRVVGARSDGSASPSAPTLAATATPASDGGAISLHADSRGHFQTSALINGRLVTMMVDTGASLCTLTTFEAEKLGLRVKPSDFTLAMATANGIARGAPVRLKAVQIGPVVVRDVEAVVVPGSLLGTNLLGMSFLRRLREFSAAGARLTLKG